MVYPEYSFKSNFFITAQHRIHYIDEGSGDVIVMVHGNPTWSYYYRRLISHLADTHRVIVIDHLGCGLSDKPQSYDYSLENHISNLENLLDYLKVTSFSMVVHDWGGAIGVGAATRKGDALQRLMVLNTAAFRSQRIPFRISVCRWPVIGQILVRGCNGFAGPAITMATTKKMNTNVAAAFLAPYNSWKNRVAVSAFVRDIPLAPDHPSYGTLLSVERGLEVLQKRKLPMLICWGGKDFCFNREFYDEWCLRFPHAQCHYFQESGHYILEDSFDDIAPLAETFFRSVK